MFHTGTSLSEAGRQLTLHRKEIRRRRGGYRPSGHECSVCTGELVCRLTRRPHAAPCRGSRGLDWPLDEASPSSWPQASSAQAPHKWFSNRFLLRTWP
ncbi:hypothetical protein CALCODRAFT_315178 [Calocera cornea HHB12733]|uniref:HTH merR-type domain-containing protein n=1 Tax=Calocera cornea HHB12733 TaxID=1353952 RepID=A0A165FCH0_9BASI|nr:hypothetical protein CALCODRAFT_315178 [Calocera cornea HHB12733]